MKSSRSDDSEDAYNKLLLRLLISFFGTFLIASPIITFINSIDEKLYDDFSKTSLYKKHLQQ